MLFWVSLLSKSYRVLSSTQTTENANAGVISVSASFLPLALPHMVAGVIRIGENCAMWRGQGVICT